MRILAIAVTFILATTALSSAQPTTSSADKRKARAHYDRAIALQKAEAWKHAATELIRAHALFPDPEFHFLIGESLEKSGDLEGALARYATYLAEDPEGRAVERATAALERVRPLVEAERARRAALKAEEDARAAAARRVSKQPSAEPVVESRSRSPRRGAGMRVAGLVSGGASLVFFGLGTKFAFDVRGAERDLERGYDFARYQDGQAAERNMIISYSVGAAALVGGALLYVLGSRSSTERAPIAAATPTPGGAMAFIRGSF